MEISLKNVGFEVEANISSFKREFLKDLSKGGNTEITHRCLESKMVEDMDTLWNDHSIHIS